MKTKYLLPLIILAACSEPNHAALRVQSDVPKAKCATGTLTDGTHVAKCTLTREDKTTVTVIAAQGGGDYPFQNWLYRTSKQIADDVKAQEAKAKESAPPPAAPTEPEHKK